MTLDLRSLLADRSLSDASRVLGAFIATNDTGEGIELRFEAISGILHGFPGKDKIRASIRPLEQLGYIVRRAGGAGHGDVFSWAGVPIGYGPNPTVIKEAEEIGEGSSRSLRSQTHPIESGQDRSLRSQTHPTSPPSSSSNYPPPPPLDARAREWVESRTTLEGCRGALLDYLADPRVDPERRLAYAQSVAGLIEGTDENVWMARDGTHVREGRQQIVAGCLNELRQGDEIGKYFPGPPGDIRNLKSKIRYRVKSETDAKRDAARDAERRSQSAGAAAATGPEPKARGGRAIPRVRVVGRGGDRAEAGERALP